MKPTLIFAQVLSAIFDLLGANTETTGTNGS